MFRDHNNLEFKGFGFFKKTPIMLGLICLLGLSLRGYFFTPDIPLTLDALGYFWYANDLSLLGHLPDYPSSNNGWPVFLSLFFSIFHFDNPLEYMVLQKSVSVTLSILTTIPVYLLSSRFFSKPYSVLGSLIFVIEPRIIQNSLLGITEPLSILLLTTALYFFLSKNDKLVYVSFGIIALGALVRSESLFVFFGFCVAYVVRYKLSKKSILKLCIAVGIFILVLSPMVLLRIQSTGSDGVISRVVSGSGAITDEHQQKSVSNTFMLVKNTSENFIKFFGWALIPFFIVFAPVGVFIMLKKRNYELISISIIFLISLLPILYAFLRSISETRYFLPLYPIIIVFTLLTIKQMSEKIKIRNLTILCVIMFLIVSSLVFLHFKMPREDHEMEALRIAKQVTSTAKVVNGYDPESKYLMVTKLMDAKKFPVLRQEIPLSVTPLPIEGFSSLDEYLKFGHNMGLTHLVLDDSKRTPIFFREIFNENHIYPYITKIYDSAEHGYKYHVKIFKIDYEKMPLPKYN